MGKIAKTANTVVLTISILLIIMVLNFLVARHLVWRVDLTKDKLYTLTDSSKKIVGGLKDQINIKAYFSQKLPPYLSNIRQDVEDLLKEYQAHAKGNLHVKFIDPTNYDEEQKRKLMFDGIMPINLQTIDKHKFEVMEAYFGMTINYEDRKESIPI
ncbi:GldG family protein, partial [Candidatus Sumerlaeota bacterium]|nr:GldG family protein [Candidatus Sumerlaeota bacterium]